MPWQTTSAGRGPCSIVVERRTDAYLLLGERLAARECEARVAGDEFGEQLGRFRLHLAERSVRPVAGVGLHQPCVQFRLQPDPGCDDLRRFARAQQRAAPQRREPVLGGALGQLGGLRATRLVERHRQLALKAPLEVVRGLTVAGEVDLRSHLSGLARARLENSAVG